MCGISAVLARTGTHGSGQTLLRMHEPIRHRGPDGEGFLAVTVPDSWERCDQAASVPSTLRLGLAFRRLKILDLSPAAAQPMGSPDGSAWIVYNGEIYNFRELRRELAASGRVFRSSGDTEVALAAFEAWGEDCFRRFEGMWAMVIADRARGRLLASRDRFGIKPLYWSLDEGRLLLASEIRQILRAREGHPRANAALVRRYLEGTRLPCLEETFFEGIRAVPPASWFEIPFEGGDVCPPAFRTYWELADHHCPHPDRPLPTYDEALAEFDSRLREAVASHDVADVTLGSLLSGGLDSSTLTSLLGERARSQQRDCPTFSFGMGDAPPEVDELRFVDVIVRRDRLRNHQAGFDPPWVREHASRVVRALEEPPLALPALAQYRIFQLCRQHDTTVVLDGQGADEVLAGYPYHQRTLLWDRLRRGRLAAFVRELRAIGRREGRSTAALLGPFLLPLLAGRVRAPPAWIAPAYGAGVDEREAAVARADRGRDASLLNRQLHYDVKWGNVKIVLGYTDKNAMAHSVEARVPYLDRRVVEFAFSLPDHYKVGGGERKRILRDAARRIIPAEITERPGRVGFGVAERDLLQGLWPVMRETVRQDGFLGGPCFEHQRADRLVEDFGAGRHPDPRAVWRLYALALWAREFAVGLG